MIARNVMSHPVITVNPENGVLYASQIMERYKVSGLPVVERGRVIGIITSRDIRNTNINRIIADAMTLNPITINEDLPIWNAFEIMEDSQIKHLPILSKGTLVGMVTKSDLLYEIGKHIDPLTGLHSSSFIRFIGERLLKDGKEILVLFFDLNNFGEFNKKYGHIYGDKCLILLGQILLSAIYPEEDYLGRFGGDEFIIISLRKQDGIVAWAESIIEKIENAFISQSLPINVSVGIAGERRGTKREKHIPSTLDDLINLASLTSTKSKKDGKSVLMAFSA
ncbi:MAG: GGDEF domain-containing protein [Dehalobacterium sp.]